MRTVCESACRRPDRAARLVLAFALAPLDLACSQADDVIARPFGSASEACARACGADDCPCPTTAKIPIEPPSGSAFAIAATEVTVAEYQVFLLTHTTPTDRGNSDVCAWNESYAPAQPSVNLDRRCLTDFNYDGFLAASPERPIVCVDWCDARDYCAWSGGRLCGRVGGGELTVQLRGTLEDEWYLACSAGGTRPYAYGNDFDASICNTRDSGNNGVSVSVSSLADCEGAEPGLFDMAGNASEWIASCEGTLGADNPGTSCYRVGGAFYQGEPSESRCDYGQAAERATEGNDNGFRCCYD